ncbi:triose-phosphate isomerase [soil metagenome]
MLSVILSDMTIKPLIAANWKMHKTPSEAESWTRALLKRALNSAKADIAICAPFTHLCGLRRVLGDSPVDSPVALGAQDLSRHGEGAYTGEFSAAMLVDLGVRYVIVGHSERREHHRETDELVNGKVKAALEHGLVPILCVGESLGQRENGDTETVVLGQLERGLEGALLEGHDLVVAYEPIWAIGTGKTAGAADAQEVCGAIRNKLAALYPERGTELRILYGGSVKPGNAAELLAQRDVNGGLVGGASLEIDSLLGILGAA